MELRGIEPLSEIPSIRLSSTTVAEILFPYTDPQRQTSMQGSFINFLMPQSLSTRVFRLDDAGEPIQRTISGRRAALRQLKLIYYC